MPWSYSQSTGQLTYNSAPAGEGYSGTGAGRNNPDMQSVPNVGPIPMGAYTIGDAHDTATHGPRVLRLTPVPGTNTYHRDGFLIHGDNRRHDASQGCIILNRAIRDRIGVSNDRTLTVTR